MKLARKKMDCYYSLTDSSNVYRIAMVLHPGMKLEYFHNQKWQGGWIEQAEILVRAEYVVKYEKAADESNTAPSNNLNTDDGFASFGNLSVTTCPRASEIQEYLSLPVKNVKDPLKWWTDNKYMYPNLHRMALNYLSIPGKSSLLFYMKLTLILHLATSTAVERVFSQGCHLLPFTRNSLSPSSIRAFLCFGSWSRCGLVVFDDVVAAVSMNNR